jgi:hypothetical protein
MLDDFPELHDRVEQYLKEKKDLTQSSLAYHTDPRAKELFQKAVGEYPQEHWRKRNTFI